MNNLIMFMTKSSVYLINRVLIKGTIFIISSIAHSIKRSAIKPQEYKLNYVIDGDTVNMIDNNGNEQKIRLFGIDTPEKFNSMKLEKDIKNGNSFLKQMLNKNISKEEIIEAGELSSNYLKTKLQKGNTYKVEIISSDKYNRLLAVLYSGNENINETLIKNGYAVVQNQYIKNPSELMKLNSLQMKAQCKKSGLWESHGNVMNSL